MNLLVSNTFLRILIAYLKVCLIFIIYDSKL